MEQLFELEISWGLISKLIAILVTIVTALTPFIVAIIGIIYVRQSLKRKENAEAKRADAQADLAKEEMEKIRLESRQTIREIIHEPTINEICEGYRGLLESMEKRITGLESTINNCEKKNEELVKELAEAKEQKEIVEIENDELRDALNKLGGN